MLAEQAGHEIDLTRIDPEAWNEASIKGFHRVDYTPIREIIVASLLISP